MKKLFVLMLGIVLFTSCENKEKEFDQNLRMAYNEMAKTGEASSDVCNAIADTWRDAIMLNIKAMDMNGIEEQVNNAITKVYGDFEEKGVIDSISVCQEKMQLLISKMTDVPENRKDCYNDFMDIATDVNSLARMAKTPGGSYKGYVDEKNECTKSIQEKCDKFKMKYGAILRGE